ncbi:MAG: DUF58 domain-containing protein, partial [Phycisphaerales bacterium]|nr:DUF58 domain-containing protein [Phycisphaerales bacterium]
MIPVEVLKKVRRIQIVTSAIVNDVFAGQYHSAFKGRGIEFEEVREYQPGDDVRTIDWNVTARAGRPFVKSYREERELTVMLVVDVSASQQFGTREAFKSELAAELGATLALPVADDWQLRTRVNTQWTPDALVPGEQFGMGGAQSVRGYEERE